MTWSAASRDADCTVDILRSHISALVRSQASVPRRSRSSNKTAVAGAATIQSAVKASNAASPLAAKFALCQQARMRYVERDLLLIKHAWVRLNGHVCSWAMSVVCWRRINTLIDGQTEIRAANHRIHKLLSDRLSWRLSIYLLFSLYLLLFYLCLFLIILLPNLYLSIILVSSSSLDKHWIKHFFPTKGHHKSADWSIRRTTAEAEKYFISRWNFRESFRIWWIFRKV